MNSLVSHHHRQFMEYLSTDRWTKAISLPERQKAISTMLSNGWIEVAGDGAELPYRMTASGLAAKKTRVKQ